MSGTGRDEEDPDDQEHGIVFQECVKAINWTLRARAYFVVTNGYGDEEWGI